MPGAPAAAWNMESRPNSHTKRCIDGLAHLAVGGANLRLLAEAPPERPATERNIRLARRTSTSSRESEGMIPQEFQVHTFYAV